MAFQFTAFDNILENLNDISMDAKDIGGKIGGAGSSLFDNFTSVLSLPSKLFSSGGLIIMAILAVVLIPVVAPVIMSGLKASQGLPP